MKFYKIAITEAFKYGNKYYRKKTEDTAEEAVSGKTFKFPPLVMVEKDKQ